MADKLFYTVIITSLLIAIIIIFFVISVIRYHQRYINPSKRKDTGPDYDAVRQERKRIANDLHDSLSRPVATVKLYLHGVCGK